MPRKAMHPCQHPGCPNVCSGRYCGEHKGLHPNGDRKSAAERGYGSKWQPLCKKHHDLKTWNEDKNPVYKY